MATAVKDGIIAVDNGFWANKYTTSNGLQGMFSSFAAQVDDSLPIARSNPALIEIGGTKWLVGDDANRLADATTPMVDSNWVRSEQYKVLAFYAFKRAAITGGKLITGLSLEYIKPMTSVLNEVVKSWREYGYDFEVPHPLPQPAGTIFELGLDDTGQIVRDYQDAKLLDVDVGGGTIDVMEIVDFEFTYKYASSTMGVQTAYLDILHHIRDKVSPSYRLSQMPEVVQAGHVMKAGKELSIRKQIEEARQRLFGNVLETMSRKWKSTDQFNRLIFTGGGAAFLEPLIKKQFKDQAVIPSDCAMANVRGYLKYAQHVL